MVVVEGGGIIWLGIIDVVVVVVVVVVVEVAMVVVVVEVTEEEEENDTAVEGPVFSKAGQMTCGIIRHGDIP